MARDYSENADVVRLRHKPFPDLLREAAETIDDLGVDDLGEDGGR